jgi:hypothetical protein
MAVVITSEDIDSFLKSANNAEARARLGALTDVSGSIGDLAPTLDAVPMANGTIWEPLTPVQLKSRLDLVNVLSFVGPNENEGSLSLNNFTSSGHVGDGTTTAFTLSFVPRTEIAQAFVVGIDGVLQSPIDAYTVSRTTGKITFSSAPPVNSKIVVTTSAAVTGYNMSDTTVTATGSTTSRLLTDRFADVVNVLDFGAVGDGVTDDTAAFQAAIDSLPNDGGELILVSENYALTLQNLVYGTKNILWTGPSKVNGSVLRDLDGINEIYSPSLKRRTFYEPNGESNTFARWDYQRVAQYTGGPSGSPDTALRVFTDVESTVGDGNRKAEWAFQGRIDNSSDWANAVAVTGQARRNAGGAVWSGQFNTIDYTPTTGFASRAIEANIQADGIDSNQLRWIVDIVGHNIDDVYAAGADRHYLGLYVRAGSADLTKGIRVSDNSSTGKITDTGIEISTDATTLISAKSITGSGLVRIGSSLNAGVVGQLLFEGENSVNFNHQYAEIRAQITDATDGSEDGVLKFYSSTAGTPVEHLRLNGGVAANPLSVFVNGSLKQVTEGATDSGGAGFKQLIVPN